MAAGTMRSKIINWLIFPAVVCFISFAFLEGITRAYFAYHVGVRVLYYGSGGKQWADYEVDDVRKLEGELQGLLSEPGHKRPALRIRGYTKYFPNEQKATIGVDPQRRIPVHINKQGFRGKDFVIEKTPGTIRIATLGSSSTFGFFDEDDETYPYYLEQELNKRCKSTRYEVLNLAIPHAIMTEIEALFEAEVLPLNPDIVTFYEGRNDSMRVHTEASEQSEGSALRIWNALYNRVLLVRFIGHMLEAQEEQSANFAWTPKERARLAEVKSDFLGGLASVNDTCRERGIRFIVANQQASSLVGFALPMEKRLRLRGVTYQAEVDEIQSKLTKMQPITPFQAYFLVHAELMQALEAWTEEQDVEFIDLIGLLDQHRHLMMSWVHLHPEANRMIANSLAERILPETCTELRSQPSTEL